LETLFDYTDRVFLLDEPNRMKERCDNICLEFSEVFTSALERGDAVPGHEALMRTWDYCANEFSKKRLLLVNQLMVQSPDLPPKAIVKADGNSVIQYLGKIDMLAKDVAMFKQSGYSVALLSGGSARAQRLADDLYKYGIEAYVITNPNPITPKTVGILPLTLQHSSIWPDIKLAVICENDIFGVTKKKRTSRKANTGGKLRAFTDLNPGDYVVHDTHGIGVYVGTIKLDVDGKTRDYIHLRYNGTDKLYIPTDQMDRIQKYIGNTEVAPKLSKLGGGDWEKQKNKVRRSVKELAFDLIKLYAQRQQNPGHKFGSDTPWQHEFEDKFPYEETPDQRRSIEEIKLDMERPVCMDRLLCGDVGYGKTEVALRAAFKAVMDNKQVAILVPTTILAQQHYQTVMKRFEGFPVKVSVLSRFKSASEQKQIIKNVNSGDVDIIIGTHKLLNNDIRFKDLGLLIIDEEQRFGVAHKEKIKNLKQHIDVLTLSATPIPRTLHMSMVGIRDMSTLETPPEERYPIQTFVSEYNDSAIRDIILREVSRGGQVYFVYNHVQSIDRFASHLRMLVPEVKIAVGHGQMKESQLEDIMIDFMDGKYDVLLCSTIIETGLDIPAVNTMIIYDADRFGLSQLYQLRGRVGRSNRIAYCYLTVRANKIISETAQKRLSAIKEFTQFGSGFKIAMRDLEIRGAGNILGAQQSGHMAAVGYDMYVKLIQEQVSEISGDARIARPEASVNISVDAFLPDDYVKGHSLRMDIYQLIAQVSSANDKDDCIDELLDRFGDMPKACENLVYIAYLKNVCERIGVEQVFMRRRQLVLRFMQNISMDPLALLDAMKEVNCFTLSATQPPALLFDMGDDNEKGLREAAAKLEMLADIIMPPMAAD
ncbi:MAG: transcription-repair coupling factor, partial [Clostridia bacterium]|nr:transcription-repair coupling factor [Clostridia bacterium]